MTISFDAIWIPIVISVIAFSWAVTILRNPSDWEYAGAFAALSLGVAWPGLIVLGSWLVWALLT